MSGECIICDNHALECTCETDGRRRLTGLKERIDREIYQDLEWLDKKDGGNRAKEFWERRHNGL